MLISSKASDQLQNRILSQQRIFCRGLFLSAKWFIIQQIIKDGMHLVVLPDIESAQYCCSDLYTLIEGDKVSFFAHCNKNVERSNYKSSLAVQRTDAINRITNYKSGLEIIITYPEALNELIPSKEQLKESFLTLKVGDEISYEQILQILTEKSFERVDFVSSPGQFALRGSIVDVFSYSNNYPYRINFWGKEVEKINTFDCNTQLSIENKESIEIIPDLSSNTSELTSLFNILPSSTTLWLDSSDMYKDEDFFQYVNNYKSIYFDVPLSETNVNSIQFNIKPQPSFNKNFDILSDDIKTKIENNYKVYIYGEKKTQLERIKTILLQNDVHIPEFVVNKTIHRGFIDEDNKVCIYSDHEIFDRFQRVSIRRSVEKSEQLTINDLNSFNIGDYIVHIDHGVGIFGGLVRLRDDKGRLKEVVKLSYKDGDVVFVSVHSLNKISRFRSKDGEAPRIHKLGSKTWQTLKNNAKSKVKDIAKDLIKLYAKRRASVGFAYNPDTYLQQELESSFIYEDTPDQETATIAVKADMEDTCPMDRLICGDVGFGKTEIAIRAAFKAVADSKQVAVLVPTTILAFQHYNTFINRLKNLPCNIDYISRLRTTKEINNIKTKIKSGEIDILIGTHKLLNKEFEFKDLGLLIIDEEQKFGVSAKEKLREFKSSIDTLTLSATPIPRTLQFSLLGARDLSIINTPPSNRIPIQTEIILFNEDEIKSIINYELNRGGQLFFLHNRVEQLQSIKDILIRLVPDMKICIAHGQMEAKKLEDTMLSFMRGDYDMMLCTTLIENGLDIPNVNTIIINQAQNFGLSDLHQLRGRVGRSNKKAFCYLIVPPLVSITEDARRRLKAIEEFSDLGSGFNIAMQDLDIRGAGNLLGAEQSGFITEMGYETYQKILSEAMEELGLEIGSIPQKSIAKSFVSECVIETDQVALIPDEYLDITAEKLRIYKAIDSIVNEKELINYQKRIEDRFGIMPQELNNLFYVVRIRNMGTQIGFEKIIFKNGLLIAFFTTNTQYYKSDTFEIVFTNIGVCGNLFEFKQVDSKFKLLSRGVNSLEEVYNRLSKLQVKK